MVWHGILNGGCAVAILISGGRDAAAQVTPLEALPARRDAQLSKPDEIVWDLRWSNPSDRMRLTPDMAARVEKLD